MKIITIFSLVIFCFSYCGKGKNRTTQEERVVDIQEALNIEEEAGAATDHKPINKYIRLIYPFEKDEFVAYNSSENTAPDDSIAIGVLGDNYEPVLLAKNLKLGSKWICIALPFQNGNQTLKIDTLRTVSHITVTEPYEYQATSLSVKDKLLNMRVYGEGNPNDEESVNYDVAFRGNYTQKDFHLYEKIIPSYQDSLYVMTIIEEAMDKANIKSPYIFAEEPSELALKGMYKLKKDLFIASFRSGEEEYLDCNDMLVSNGKIILWSSAYFGVETSVFQLGGQDYIYISRAVNHAAAWDVYKLHGDQVENVYRMTMTD